MGLAERLGLAVPLVQAPMAGVATPELAAAASNAGALGGLGLAAMSPAQAAEAMAATRALTDRPFGVNLFCHRPARRDPAREAAWLELMRPAFEAADAPVPTGMAEIYIPFPGNDEMQAVIEAANPAVVSFHFGLPQPDQLDRLRAMGAVLLGSATSLAEARAIRDAGLDGIVAQGWEAGGHRGMFDPDGPDERLSTRALLELLLPVGLPVIAAGGIMTAEDVRRMLDHGADLVQCGTAFLRCPESATQPSHKALMSTGRTVMTRSISGRPARSLENRLTALPSDLAPDYPLPYDPAKALMAAARKAGIAGYNADWAGTGAAQAVEEPAAQVVARLTEGLR
ncbi:NAD(P)H-dependent flavin oxidoreductase [Paracoccus pacificus]|uniref:Propionate 3-nitronate monooxygenase n=1 Tax=Paracoccus pacificus TaxID=1463598 RepID=A0ABW4R5A4_9RHOB